MGIATVGIPSTGRFSTCRTVNTAALHILIISPQTLSAWSRNNWVSTVFCSTVLQRMNYKSVRGVVWYRNTDNLVDFKGKVLNSLQRISRSRPMWDDNTKPSIERSWRDFIFYVIKLGLLRKKVIKTIKVYDLLNCLMFGG